MEESVCDVNAALERFVEVNREIEFPESYLFRDPDDRPILIVASAFGIKADHF